MIKFIDISCGVDGVVGVRVDVRRIVSVAVVVVYGR